MLLITSNAVATTALRGDPHHTCYTHRQTHFLITALLCLLLTCASARCPRACRLQVASAATAGSLALVGNYCCLLRLIQALLRNGSAATVASQIQTRHGPRMASRALACAPLRSACSSPSSCVAVLHVWERLETWILACELQVSRRGDTNALSRREALIAGLKWMLACVDQHGYIASPFFTVGLGHSDPASAGIGADRIDGA